jgi:hypothetical protein
MVAFLAIFCKEIPGHNTFTIRCTIRGQEKEERKRKEKQQEVFQPIIERNQKGMIRRRTQRNLLL